MRKRWNRFRLILIISRYAASLARKSSVTLKAITIASVGIRVWAIWVRWSLKNSWKSKIKGAGRVLSLVFLDHHTLCRTRRDGTCSKSRPPWVKIPQTGKKFHRIYRRSPYKAIRRRSRIADGMSDVFMSEVVLEQSGITTFICQIITGWMS